MVGENPKSWVLFLCLAISLTASAAPQKRRSSKKPAPKPVVVQPAAPLPPPTPEQSPAVQPRVTFQQGLLLIDAPNSTMADVLNGVRHQIGAKIEIPPGSGADRVVARIGPGKPRDVLASLLAGSHFDYIILGPPQNPSGVQRVILSRRQAAPTGAPPSENASAAQPSFRPQVIPPPDEGESEEIEPEVPEEAPQPEATAPTMQPGQDPQQQGQGQGQQNPNQPKSPEQLLQELQRMQQQQQQQQQPDPNQQPQPSPDRNPNEE
jgi:hypothetical protein